MWVATEWNYSKKIKNCIADQNIKTKQKLIFLVWCILILDFAHLCTTCISSPFIVSPANSGSSLMLESHKSSSWKVWEVFFFSLFDIKKSRETNKKQLKVPFCYILSWFVVWSFKHKSWFGEFWSHTNPCEGSRDSPAAKAWSTTRGIGLGISQKKVLVHS